MIGLAEEARAGLCINGVADRYTETWERHTRRPYYRWGPSDLDVAKIAFWRARKPKPKSWTWIGTQLGVDSDTVRGWWGRNGNG